MKTLFSLGLAFLVATSGSAQVFRSEAVKGAVLGGIAGGIIGHNSGDLRHNGWKGAAIGATAGLLIGQAVGQSNAHRHAVHSHGGYVHQSVSPVHVGFGFGHAGYHGYRHHDVGRYDRGGWGHRRLAWHGSYLPSYRYHRGYGHGYPHIGYRDYVDYAYPSPFVVSQPQSYVSEPQPLIISAPAPVAQPQPAPQQVTIINNYYGTPSPMGAANGLFGR